MFQTVRRLAILALLTAAPAAHAAVSVLGAGPARACFEAARDGNPNQTGLRDCDAALSGQDLTWEDRAATLVNRGVIYLHRREGAAALADFERALRRRPDLGEAHVNRGAALILLSRPEDAIAAITEGLALGSADPHEAHFNRAIAHEMRGDLRAAYEDFRRATELQPGWTLAEAELARFTVSPR